MGGNALKSIPGEFQRRGPNQESGLTRSDHTGSTSRLSPAICISTLEWPIMVMMGCWLRAMG